MTRLATRITVTALSHAPVFTRMTTVPQSLHNAIFIIELIASKIKLSLDYIFYAMVSILILSRLKAFVPTKILSFPTDIDFYFKPV